MSNTFTITGRLTADPELRFTPQGKAVANFTVADNHKRPDGNGGWIDDGATFIRAQAWGALGENITERLHKGSYVTVVGQLRQRDWEKDGVKRTSYELRAQSVSEPIPTFNTASTGGGGKPAAAADDPWGTSNTTDAPF